MQFWKRGPLLRKILFFLERFKYVDLLFSIVSHWKGEPPRNTPLKTGGALYHQKFMAEDKKNVK